MAGEEHDTFGAKLQQLECEWKNIKNYFFESAEYRRFKSVRPTKEVTSSRFCDAFLQTESGCRKAACIFDN